MWRAVLYCQRVKGVRNQKGDRNQLRKKSHAERHGNKAFRAQNKDVIRKK